jgi:hypothetical protein
VGHLLLRILAETSKDAAMTALGESLSTLFQGVASTLSEVAGSTP